MKGIHPNLLCAAKCALVSALLAGGGCRSSSSGITNPFLAPDRVAPPSTHVLAPGQAQPYYQGDPLPAMQSAAAATGNAAVASNNAADARSSSGRTLAWNAPGGIVNPAATAPAGATANAFVPWGTAPSTAAPVAQANEPAVTVPVDSDALRFALPAPPSAPPTAPIAATTAVPETPQPIQFTPTPPNQGVQQASYNVPVPTAPPPAPSMPPLSQTPVAAVASPWRSPSIAQTPSAPLNGSPPASPQYSATPPQLAAGQPVFSPAPIQLAPPTNTMAVQLRAVPSPPPEPGDPNPRIRIPGYDVPETAAADGFRPRSTMR